MWASFGKASAKSRGNIYIVKPPTRANFPIPLSPIFQQDKRGEMKENKC